jgi:hypothetical protein
MVNDLAPAFTPKYRKTTKFFGGFLTAMSNNFWYKASFLTPFFDFGDFAVNVFFELPSAMSGTARSFSYAEFFLKCENYAEKASQGVRQPKTLRGLLLILSSANHHRYAHPLVTFFQKGYALSQKGRQNNRVPARIVGAVFSVFGLPERVCDFEESRSRTLSGRIFVKFWRYFNGNFYNVRAFFVFLLYIKKKNRIECPLLRVGVVQSGCFGKILTRKYTL